MQAPGQHEMTRPCSWAQPISVRWRTKRDLCSVVEPLRRSMTSAARLGRARGPIRLALAVDEHLVQVAWGRRVVARGPTLALACTIAVGLLSLVVQQNHTGRERQV